MSDIQPVRILLADSDENAAENLVSAFRNAAIPVRAQFVASEAALNNELQRQVWDLLLFRQGAELGSLTDVVARVRQYDAALPVLSLETDADPDRLTAAMRDGAADAILPGQDDRLLLVVRRELSHARERVRLRRAESAVSEVEHRADLLLEVIDAGVAYVLDGMHVAANRVYLEMFGYADLDDLLGATMLDLVTVEHKEAFKQSLRAVAEGTASEFGMHGLHRDGSTFEATMTVLSAAYEGEPCWQVVLRRASGRRGCATNPVNDALHNGAEITEVVMTDVAPAEVSGHHGVAVTAGAERDHILTTLQSFHAQATAENAPATLVSLLLINYAELRAFAGLEPIWRVTAVIAELLDEALHAPHRILRIADDVFVLLLHDMDAISAEEEIEQLAREISAQCARDSGGSLAVRIATTAAALGDIPPHSLAELTQLLRVPRSVATPAIDTAPAPTPPDQKDPFGDAHELSDDAAAMVEAITNGVHKPTPTTLLTNEQILPRLQACLADSTFVLYFQPIISVRGDSDEHYEAFLRMPLAANGSAMLSAEEFLGAAMQAGLGAKIDRWVILQAITLLSAHRASGHDTRLTINLCATSMLDPNFINWLGVAIRAARLPSDALIFQVTEVDAVASLQQAKAFMRGMHELHCRTSLSRFTGGGNPTQLLRHLSVDFVKLDPSLIDAVQAHPERKDDLSKLIALLQSQGRLTIVPMVENAKLLAALWQAGANYIQGHYLQEPSTEMDFDFTSDE